MAGTARYPSLFQINTRVWLQRLSRQAGKRITLADIDDATIDGFAERGFDWIWLLSVWQIGAAGRAVSRGNPQWRSEFQAVLPDLTEDDICGSGFAITGYTVNDTLGGEAGLAQFRERLARRGLKVMLDFVPNHSAPDHPWVKTHPDYYVEGNEEALAGAPGNYLRVGTDRGPQGSGLSKFVWFVKRTSRLLEFQRLLIRYERRPGVRAGNSPDTQGERNSECELP